MTVEVDGKSYFKLFWHSDEHTLHPHTPTSHILNNISTVRKEVGVDSIDMEVWGGDLCHDITQTSDTDFLYLQYWTRSYLLDCHERKRIVRIFEGTFSHDRGQPKMFELLKPKESPYIRYIDKMEIEFFPQFDIHVMYVPDNFGRKPKQEIYEEALAMIAAHGLQQVDFIFFHGAFDFQLPVMENNKDIFYDAKQWSLLAKKIILSGHIHKPSHKYNIYSSGSFDRIAHGEMHPKGAYQVLFNKDEVIPTFIENKNAMIYDTIFITPETTSLEITRLLDKYIEKNPMNGASIRVKGGTAEIVSPVIAEYAAMYVQYNFDVAHAVEKGVQVDDVLYAPENYKGIVLDKTNLEDHLFRFMDNNKSTPKDVDRKYISELLKELEGDGG